MPYKKSSTPYLFDISLRGWIRGLTLHDPVTGKSQCHYFGGIPYALPAQRWKKARQLPPCYRYGSRSHPGIFENGASMCPQMGPGGDIDEGDEDCLQCNVWVPLGQSDEKGWPILFFIHGGFLQFGTPNGVNAAALLAETELKCIVVMPAYRLNVFGFLAVGDPAYECDIVPNLGFWDLRMALEWTYMNISYFGGDASNITVAGYSAGSHCVFHQLAYDLNQPDSKGFIRKVIMWSNGPGVQPKSLNEAQEQFDEFVEALNFPNSLTPAEKISKLRSLNPNQLLLALKPIKNHQFRAVTDGVFVKATLFQEVYDGVFAKRLKERNIRIIIGECADEHFIYRLWRPPQENFRSLYARLRADYPESICSVIQRLYLPNRLLPSQYKNWRDAFGHIYADMQIHMLERGFINALTSHGAAELVHRYRIEWRAKCVDKMTPREWGVTHGTDMALWFWGNGERLEEEEKKLIHAGFVEQLGKFLKGEKMNWGALAPTQVRILDHVGQIRIGKDKDWDRGVRVWKALRQAGSISKTIDAKL